MLITEVIHERHNDKEKTDLFLFLDVYTILWWLHCVLIINQAL